MVLRTLGYMSPEQLRGKPVDARSDIFSFGAILYEMLSGKRAFIRDSAADTMTAILREDLPDLSLTNRSISPGLERILRHCLEKNREQRFQSARDLAFDLQEVLVAPQTVRSVLSRSALRLRPRVWLAVAGIGVGVLLVVLATSPELRLSPSMRAGPGRIASVAVLPLRDLSGEPRQEYFVDGMTEALTANLAQIGALVISSTSSMLYKGTKKPLRQIARELGVDAVLEGSVARVGDRVRITSQLIHAEGDTHLWAKSFERDIRDILALQGEVAREVARQVKAELTADERARLTEVPRIEARAYEAYLLGRFFLGQGTEDSLKKALEHFNKALEIDKDYAAPYAGIASYYAILPFYTQLSPADSTVLAHLQLDPRLASLRSDPRFLSLLQRMGVSQPQARRGDSRAQARASC